MSIARRAVVILLGEDILPVWCEQRADGSKLRPCPITFSPLTLYDTDITPPRITRLRAAGSWSITLRAASSESARKSTIPKLLSSVFSVRPARDTTTPCSVNRWR